VAEYHQKRHAQNLDRIFHARQPILIDEIAGNAHDKNVARSLLEEKLGRHSAV